MDPKPDSQKRPLCQLDDNTLSCLDCKDLEEHRNKNCPNQFSKQTTDSSKAVDVASGKDDYAEKRQCYRCDDCHLSFAGSQNIEDHLKENCLKMPVIDPNQAKTYESCMNTLRSAMYNEKCYFDSLRTARVQTSNAVKRYSSVKKRKDHAHKVYTEAIAREQTLCTIVSTEEQQILSHLTARYLQNLKAAMKELEIAGEVLNCALQQLKNHNNIAMFAATKVHFAYSDAIQAFGELRLDSDLPPEVERQELKNIRDVLKQRHRNLTELQDGVKELEASVSVMLEIELKNEPEPAENESVIEATPNTMQETVDSSQPNHMDVVMESMDNQRPSTSMAYSE